MTETKIRILMELTPLGQLNIEWIIPNSILKDRNEFGIEVPGYKYDLPTFASIPTPFSSKSYELQITNVKFPAEKIFFKEEIAPYDNKTLLFDNFNQVDSEADIRVSFSIKNILNNDGIYFVMVYPFRSPFENIEHYIQIKSKVSYNIRQFKFIENLFSYPDNSKLHSQQIFQSSKTGDEIIVNGIYKPTHHRTLDLHFTATRLPIFIRRDIFWMTIFIVFILIALSPYVVAIIELSSK